MTQIPDDETTYLISGEWDVPWHSHILPSLIVALFGIVWFTGLSEAQPALWRLSRSTIEQGQVASVFLHMFAHGGLVHLGANALALLVLGGPLVANLGRAPESWLRFLYLFIGSGLSGGAMFLLVNWNNPGSLLGASGAIFGILGALARVHPLTGTSLPIRSGRTWLVAKFFIQNHIALFAIISLIALTSGQLTLLAWEAHLGGLLFGFFAAPAFLARSVGKPG